MDDRELLELAAKAAGRDLTRYEWNNGLYWMYQGDNTHYWSPLEKYGDALGLAIKLRMGIHYETQFIDGKDVEIVEVYHSHNEEDRSCKCVTEEIGDNAGAALMRAITRAAAETQLQKERNET